MAATNVKVDPNAYTLPLLHAAKYPHAQVCGVLVGEVNAKDGSLHVVSGMPLFHHWTTLTPMLEVALRQAELFASKRNWKILGWYQANADRNDTTLHENAIRVADTIRRNVGCAVIFSVNNQKLEHLDQNADGGAVVPYMFIDNQWRPVKQAYTNNSNIVLTNEDTHAKVRGMISSSAYNSLVDFDEHLEDPSLDWLSYVSKSG